jgi:hypothetical protein
VRWMECLLCSTRAFYEHIQRLQCCSSFLRRSGTTRCHSASRTYQALINPLMPFCKRKPLLSIRQLKKKKPWINNYITDQIHGEKENIGISLAIVI